MNYALTKAERQQQYLTEHERMANLFITNRFAFELERKRLLHDAINQAYDHEKLQKQQNEWDRILDGMGSAENRFAMVQSLFWHHFVNRWQPALEDAVTDLNTSMKNKFTNRKSFLMK